MKNKIVIVILLMFATSCARTPANITNYKEQAVENATLSRVYFPFASDALLPEATVIIDRNTEWLKKHDDIYFILEGHCDEVGQAEYNMELGDRRARAVKAHMLESGIPNERIIMVVSYGSSHPLNLGKRVEDLRENRRVEFVIR